MVWTLQTPCQGRLERVLGKNREKAREKCTLADTICTKAYTLVDISTAVGYYKK
jgi:hypothetical protein